MLGHQGGKRVGNVGFLTAHKTSLDILSTLGRVRVVTYYSFKCATLQNSPHKNQDMRSPLMADKTCSCIINLILKREIYIQRQLFVTVTLTGVVMQLCLLAIYLCAPCTQIERH